MAFNEVDNKLDYESQLLFTVLLVPIHEYIVNRAAAKLPFLLR